jgi:hypothetical protein
MIVTIAQLRYASMMRRTMTNTRFFRVCISGSLCAVMVGCSGSGGHKPAAPQILSLPGPTDVPASLNAPSNEVLTLQLHGTGVQIYQCQAAQSDPARFEWSLKRPEANLFNQKGKNIGKHYGGPTWQASDGSQVTGEVLARANSPTPNAIPWLLLSAKTTSGKGIFAQVKFIQRLHTEGGAAPSSGCSHTEAGEELRVSYAADYLFYVAQP